jgi:hypothetical protein
MIHLIYTYLIINSFIAGYFFNENDRWESRKYAIGFSILCLVFGGLILLTYPLFLLFTPILGWFYKEISFQYRFYCTDFWDKIFLDDNYSEDYKTREEKLKRSEQLVKNGSKQLQRHNKQIQKKYGNK